MDPKLVLQANRLAQQISLLARRRQTGARYRRLRQQLAQLKAKIARQRVGAQRGLSRSKRSAGAARRRSPSPTGKRAAPTPGRRAAAPSTSGDAGRIASQLKSAKKKLKAVAQKVAKAIAEHMRLLPTCGMQPNPAKRKSCNQKVSRAKRALDKHMKEQNRLSKEVRSLEKKHTQALQGACKKGGKGSSACKAFMDKQAAVMRKMSIKPHKDLIWSYYKKKKISRKDYHRLKRLLDKGDMKGYSRLAKKILPQGWDFFRDTDIGRGLKKAGEWVGQAVKDVGKFIGKAWEEVKGAVCATIGMPICMIVELVKGAAMLIKRIVKYKDVGKALKSIFEDWMKELKRRANKVISEMKRLFAGFKKMLMADRFDGKSIGAFFKNTFERSRNAFKTIAKGILPGFINEIVSSIVGGVATAALGPAGLGMAAINFAFRKLMGWLLPKLILGAGKAFNFVNKHLPKGFKEIVQKILKFVGVPALGVIAEVFGKGKGKNRIKTIFLQVANVAGRIQKGIEGSLKVAEAVRTGKFESIEKALQSQNKLPTQLGPQDYRKIVDGLVDFAQDAIMAALNDPLRKLMGKALQLLHKLIDIPRNALVTAVGSIPFVGGVISGVLNTALGFLADMIDEALIEQVQELVKDLVGSQLKSLAKPLKRVLANPRNAKAAKGFVQLVKTVGEMAGTVKETLESASKGIRGTIGSLVSTALDKLLLRGIRDPDVRSLIAKAAGEVIDQLTKKGGFSLTSAIVSVLQKVKAPLTSLVTKSIQHQKLRGLVQKGLQGLIGALANSGGVKRIMKNPLGFLSQVAKELLLRLKDELAGLVLGRIRNTNIRNVVATAIGTLASTVEREGFSALLRFDRLLGKLFSALKQPLLGLLLQKVRKPQIKTILENGLAFVASEIESKGVGEILRTGVIAFFARLLERVKEPLVNLILKDVPFPEVRQVAMQGLEALIAKAKSGDLDALLNFNKVVQTVEAAKAKAPAKGQAKGKAAPQGAQAKGATTAGTTKGLQVATGTTSSTSAAPGTKSTGAESAAMLDSVRGGNQGATLISRSGKKASPFVAGKDALRKQLEEAWSSFTKVDCGGVVGALAPVVDPMGSFVAGLLPSGLGTTCHKEFLSGFVCAIPDALASLGKMIGEIAAAAWTNRATCAPAALKMAPSFLYMGLSAPLGGVLVCGIYHYLKAKYEEVVDDLKRAYGCFRSLDTDQVLRLILQKAAGVVCNVAGGLAFDAVVAILTGGTGTAASVARWVTKIKDWLEKFNPMTYVKKLGSGALKKAFNRLPDAKLAQVGERLRMPAGEVRQQLLGSSDTIYDLANGYFTNSLADLKECGIARKRVPPPRRRDTSWEVFHPGLPGAVIKDGARVWTRPSWASQRVGSLPKGTWLTITGRQGDWYRIQGAHKLKWKSRAKARITSGTEVFVAKRNIEIRESRGAGAKLVRYPQARAAAVSKDGASVRAEAAKAAATLGTLARGTGLWIVGEQGSWLKIRDGARLKWKSRKSTGPRAPTSYFIVRDSVKFLSTVGAEGRRIP